MIFVPVGTEGMTMEPIDTMGGRETNTLYFNDCEVPAEQLLGDPGFRCAEVPVAGGVAGPAGEPGEPHHVAGELPLVGDVVGGAEVAHIAIPTEAGEAAVLDKSWQLGAGRVHLLKMM